MAEYNFAEIEKKWQEKWEKDKIFEVKEDPKKEKYYVLEMFPYPSGSGLHMGHAWNYTIGDIIARYKKMQGYNVLHPMGYDALGLPAENAAIKVGEHPKEYTDKSIKNFIKQQKKIGLSYDWSRVVSSADPTFYRWDQWIFLKMLEKGLAYQKESAVNWCPKCQSVLANEQVQNGRCWRHEDTEVEIRHLKQWFLKITHYADELYEEIDGLNWPERTKAMQKNWIGKSHGTEIDFEINGKKWPIFTTRPDTIFGVTFMVVSAQHPRLDELVTKENKKKLDAFLKKIGGVSQKSMKEVEDLDKEGVFTGSYAFNPATGEKVPIWAGNFVVADYGSGMVMAVPAHDQRDFEFAKKYGIEIKQVINPNKTKIVTITESLKPEFYSEIKKYGETVQREGITDIYSNEIDKIFELSKEYFIGGPWYIHSEGNIKKILIYSEKDAKVFDWGDSKQNSEAKKFAVKVGIKKEFLDYDTLYRAYIDSGILINSDKFSGIPNEEAKEKITKWLAEKDFARKVVNFRLRDWGISRQRYWGTPIPVIHCGKCGVVAVPEKELPVELPMDVKFGKGNPLETNEEWVNVKCPKCGGKGKRETDTMDTFVNSSWYYLRYCDPKNNKKIFDEKKAKYWCPIDTYIGGAEHACMHLIYVRFYTKFLADLGLIDFREPAKRLFHQGMLHGENGEKMSKSKGNVVLPEIVSEKYGIDTARFFMSSLASPDKDIDWDENGVNGSLRFMNRVVSHFENVKFVNDSEEVLRKLNRTIKNVSDHYENFGYRKATIELRELFDLIEKNGSSKETLESFLKMLSPICPHVTEELWENMGNKGLICSSEWPKALEVSNGKTTQSDLNSKIVAEIKAVLDRYEGEVEKVYLYVMPFELEKLDKKIISNEIAHAVEIFAVNDPKKIDPDNKAKKAKPGKPGIWFE